MYDRYNRKINYLRISVTDRCNLRCRYCMPADGIKLLSHEDILSYEEIVEIVKAGVKKGIDKIRITGGEPLVRKNVVALIRMISDIPGIKDLAMTTNGIFLETHALSLAEAGLHRVNISLDTLDPVKYAYITRGGDINAVFRGIDAAKEAGLTPVKINCVVTESSQEKDAREVRRFCMRNALQVRFIHQMDLAGGQFSIVEGGEGGKCSSCNRLRITADGKIKPCLFSDLAFDIRKLGINKAFERAVSEKPLSGSQNHTGNFCNIGG